MGAATALAAAAAVSVVAGARGSAAADPPTGCPALYALGVQGTTESSPDAPTTSDTGMLSQVMQPLLTMASSHVEREYVPYSASFGGMPGDATPQPYAQSVTGGVDSAKGMAERKLEACPGTKLALVGYSQGAQVVSMLAKQIGAGQSPIKPEQVAAVALFADPTRRSGAAVFQSGSSEPGPVPGTSGAAVKSIGAVEAPKAEGGGIGPTADISDSFGSLAPRTASFCVPGDLSCDAPSGSPIVHVISNVAGQSQLNPQDPIAAISTVAQAVAMTAVKTAVPVINEDVKGNSLDSLSYTPRQSISKRLATASDPRTPAPTIDQTISALFKVGTIGLNAAIAVAKKVLTPDTIATVAAAGLSNPVAAFGVLGTKLLGAVVELVPPATQTRWVSQAWEAVKQNVTDNADLLNITNLLRYADTIRTHGSYANVAASPTGDSPVAWAAKWLAAAAHDIAGTPFSAGDASGGLSVDTGSAAGPGSGAPPSATSVPSVPSSTVPSTTTPGVPASGVGTGSGL